MLFENTKYKETVIKRLNPTASIIKLVSSNPLLLKVAKERRTHLQADKEDKKDQAEISKERHHRRVNFDTGRTPTIKPTNNTQVAPSDSPKIFLRPRQMPKEMMTL